MVVRGLPKAETRVRFPYTAPFFSTMAFLGELAGMISLLAYCVYIFAMLKGKARPNRATWWIWSVVGCILAASYYFSGARATMWVPVSNTVGPLIIALISLKYGEGGWSVFDRRCLAGAAFGLVLWWIFSSALLALLANLFIDFMGALPTIRKTYFDPSGENRLGWMLFLTANTLNLVAVNSWNLAIVIYPTYLFLLSGTIMTMILLRTRKGKSRKKI